MKSLVLIAAACMATPAWAAQEFNAEYVVSMEWLDDRPPLVQFEEGLGMLVAQPNHELAVDLIEAMGDVPDGGDMEALTNELSALRANMGDSTARAMVGGWLRAAEWMSSASGLPLNLGEDLYSDWFRQFWWVGPLGSLTDPEPMWSRFEAGNDPEQGLKAEFRSTWGTKLGWNALQRAPRSSSIPGDNQPYLSGGLVYFLTGARLAAGRGWLEIETGQSVRALWNGETVLFRKKGGLSQGGTRFRLPVHFQDGANSLLLVSDGSQWMNVGVRLLTEAGAPVAPGKVELDELLALPKASRTDGESALWDEMSVDWRSP
ncbi:MAG: hypothetical protein P1V35_00730, partial [Planctomycetota bacterium]|nr:hypothetical protein [Planctomycetota bacterium]